MKQLFVSQEIAKELKLKGFDEPCLAVFELICAGDAIPRFRYNFDSEGLFFNHNKIKIQFKTNNWYWSAPMYEQVTNWLRFKHDIYIETSLTSDEYKNYHQVWIKDNRGKYEIVTSDTNPSHTNSAFAIQSKSAKNEEERIKYLAECYYIMITKAIEQALKLI